MSQLPYDQTDTCLHLASSVPLLSPAPACAAPIYALCSGASHPFSPAANAHAPRKSKIQGSIRRKSVRMHLCVCVHAYVCVSACENRQEGLLDFAELY